jgi:dimeric dUTPase (all-alpha-NTP-PPase superfamily)
MASLDEQILRAAKEVVVKFIEAGRISPTGFNETFKNVYRTIEEMVKCPSVESDEENENNP